MKKHRTRKIMKFVKEKMDLMAHLTEK